LLRSKTRPSALRRLPNVRIAIAHRRRPPKSLRRRRLSMLFRTRRSSLDQGRFTSVLRRTTDLTMPYSCCAPIALARPRLQAKPMTAPRFLRIGGTRTWLSAYAGVSAMNLAIAPGGTDRNPCGDNGDAFPASIRPVRPSEPNHETRRRIRQHCRQRKPARFGLRRPRGR
jgi:hypothetical protein